MPAMIHIDDLILTFSHFLMMKALSATCTVIITAAAAEAEEEGDHC